MSAKAPTISYSVLSRFVQRGGNTDIHSHGWGMAYYIENVNDKASRLQTIRDVSPAATSLKAKEIVNMCQDKLLTRDMIAHIRYATVGEVSVENVHPFQRKLFGVEFVFAHNGDVPLFKGEDLWVGPIRGERL